MCVNSHKSVEIVTIANEEQEKFVCGNMKGVEDYSGWHGKGDHISKERYREVSNIREEVTQFPSTVLESYIYVRYITAKMHRAHIKTVYNNLRPGNELQFDNSGSFTQKLGGSSHVAHFNEPSSEILAIFFLEEKDEQADVTRSFINSIGKTTRGARIACVFSF